MYGVPRTSLVTILFASIISAQGIDDVPDKVDPPHNFTYIEGEKPWSNHIPTEITTTFEELLGKHSYLGSLVCTGDSMDFKRNPFPGIKPVCMQGRGDKMVVPLGYPTWAYETFISPSTGGLFEQEHMTKDIPLHYYDDSSRLLTKFFLLPFDDYEIPVYSIEAPKTFLPMWKQMFMAENKMDERYFDVHVRVMGAHVREIYRDSLRCEYFNVVYYYYVGWARIRLQDGFLITDDCHYLADMVDTMDYEKSFQAFEKTLPNELMEYPRKIITGAQLVDSIVSKEQIIKTVSVASPLLGFDVNKDIKLSFRGELAMELRGILDWKANRCLHAEISLVDGKISEVSEISCYVY